MESLNTFLDYVLFGKPDDAYVLVWIAETKESYWVQSKSQVAIVIEQLIEKYRGKNIYIGCGWTDQDFGRKLRAKSNQIIAIPGLWTDIDVGSEHKKQNLPATIEDARKLLAQITPIPTLVVKSGHGMHMWWLFSQPWTFTNDDDRKLAQQLSNAWQAYIRAHFKIAGWDLDGTADLSRVLRPAGTTNYKNPDAPVPVEVLYAGDDRYEPEALREWLKTHATEEMADKIPAAELHGAGDFVLSPYAEPPAIKMYALLSGDVKAKQSWEHKRKDLQDHSQSGYDMSLAGFAVKAGWTDQEVINLIIANRRMHNADLMFEHNRQYYERTLREAKKDSSERLVQFTEEEIKAIEKVERADQPLVEEIDENDKKSLLSAINRRLGIGEVPIHMPALNGHAPESVMIPALQNIVCFTRDPAIYYVQMYNRENELKSVPLGDGTQARKQSTWSRILYDERLKNMFEFSKAEWAVVLNLMANVTERQSPGVEATEQGMAVQWLNDYVGDEAPFVVGIDERSTHMRDKKPFVEKGRLHFLLTELCVWLRINRGKNVEEREMSVYLKNVGASSTTVAYKKRNGGKSAMRMWTIAYYDPSSTPVETNIPADTKAPDNLNAPPEDESTIEEEMF